MKKIFSLFCAALMCTSVMAVTYTVAGNPEAVFGTTWDEKNTANDMTLAEGTTYQLVKQGIELAKGTVQFKVCVDHAWSTAYPGSNYDLDIPSPGIYDITFTFDSDSKNVNAVAQKTGEADVLPVITLHGNFTGNDWKDTEAFTPAANKETASLKLSLNYATYGFGVKKDGTWVSNGSTFTRENNSFVITSGNGDLSLVSDASGEYTFTWTYATNTLTITFPEKGDEPAPEASYYLVGSKKGWEAAEANKFASTEVEGEYKITATLEAGETIKVLGVQSGINTYYPDGMGTEFTVTAAYAGEKTIYFRPAGNDDWKTFHEGGFFYIEANEPQEPTLANGYYLIGDPWTVQSLSAEVLFSANPGAEGEYQLTTTLTVGQKIKVVAVENDAITTWYPDGEGTEYTVDATRAGENTIYFRPIANDEWKEFADHGFFFIPAKEETAVDNVQGDKVQSTKVLRDGVLYLMYRDAMYNVQGARVQ